MKDDEARQNAQATLAAHEIARREAETWTAVRDHIAVSATDACRDDLGMSLRQTSRELGISRTTLARTLWKGHSDVPQTPDEIADLKTEYLDGVWIKVGLHRSASPDAQYEAGLIDEFERDALLEGSRRARIPIEEQIRDVVRRFPGIDSLDLPQMIVMARMKGTVPDLRHHAEEAECLVDGARRWWPAKSLGRLQHGDEIPRFIGDFERDGRYVWIPVETVTHDEKSFGEYVDVSFTPTSEGQVPAWTGMPHYEMHPVRIWR